MAVLRASSSAALSEGRSIRIQAGEDILGKGQLELTGPVAEGRTELARIAMGPGIDLSSEGDAEADAHAAREPDGLRIPPELHESEEKIAQRLVLVERKLAPSAAIRVVFDETGHGKLCGDGLPEIYGLFDAEGDRVADPALLEIHEAADADSHAQQPLLLGTELGRAFVDDGQHHLRAIPLVHRDQASRLGQYLSGEIHDQGDIGPDLDLDAQNATEGPVHGQMDGAPASSAACVALRDLFYYTYLDEAPDLIRDRRLVEAETFGYANPAYPRILPNRPDYSSSRVRPRPSPSRHYSPLWDILRWLVD